MVRLSPRDNGAFILLNFVLLIKTTVFCTEFTTCAFIKPCMNEEYISRVKLKNTKPRCSEFCLLTACSG